MGGSRWFRRRPPLRTAMRFGRSHGVVGIRWVLPGRGGRRVFARRANSDVGGTLPPQKKHGQTFDRRRFGG